MQTGKFLFIPSGTNADRTEFYQMDMVGNSQVRSQILGLLTKGIGVYGNFISQDRRQISIANVNCP